MGEDMIKLMDKLKHLIKFNKKLIVFLMVLMIVAITSGSLFVTILNNEDNLLITEHLKKFIDIIENNKVDYLFVLKNNLINNIGYIILIWLLGISIIGLPIIICMFFVKSFILGFSIGAIMATFGTKGILLALIYAFPGQIVSLLFILFLMMYAMSFSFKLIYTILKKQTINFKIMINRYLIILLIVFICILLMTLYDTYLLPKIIKSFIHFIK